MAALLPPLTRDCSLLLIFQRCEIVFGGRLENNPALKKRRRKDFVQSFADGGMNAANHQLNNNIHRGTPS